MHTETGETLRDSDEKLSPMKTKQERGIRMTTGEFGKRKQMTAKGKLTEKHQSA